MLTLLLATVLLHPNPGASLPAPVITELTNLSKPELEHQSPQSLIFYDDGLVGYFPYPQLWRAPVWTTPAVYHPDVEHPWLWVHWIHEHRDDCPPSDVPEPGAMLMVAAGLMALALRKR